MENEYSARIEHLQKELASVNERSKSLEQQLKIAHMKNDQLQNEYKKLSDDYGKLAELVFIDPLTMLYNKKGFEVLLDNESSKVNNDTYDKRAKYGYLFSFLIFDVDRFKSFNDDYGHAAGDTILQEVANIIRKRLRLSDTSGRWGGDEFTIIFPFIGYEKAEKPANDLREIIANHDFEIKDMEGRQRIVRASISGGLVDAKKVIESDLCREQGLAKATLCMADKAMYIAKETKNSLCISH